MPLQYICQRDSIEIKRLEKNLKKKRVIKRWGRTFMGCRVSPFVAVRANLLGEETVKGDRLQQNNPFAWDRYCLNLPGQKDYNPKISWGSKVKIEADGSESLASDFRTYVDDLRFSGKTQDDCRMAMHAGLARAQKLGQQDAPRKRRQLHQGSNAWAGSVIETSGDGVYVTVDKTKWEKGQGIVREL